MPLIDVIDALGSTCSYKEPWPSEKILELIKQERGVKFQPEQAAFAEEHFDGIMGIREQYPD